MEMVTASDSFCTSRGGIFLAIPVFVQGSSKSGYLGEASIDFADFLAETKPSTVSLPLKFANSGAVLHVSPALSLSLSNKHKHTRKIVFKLFLRS